MEEIVEMIGGTTGLLIAVGAVVAAPLLLRALRPVAKASIKGGMAIADGARTATDRLRTAGDKARVELSELVEEAKTERTPTTA